MRLNAGSERHISSLRKCTGRCQENYEHRRKELHETLLART